MVQCSVVEFNPNTKILHSGCKGQEQGDSRIHGCRILVFCRPMGSYPQSDFLLKGLSFDADCFQERPASRTRPSMRGPQDPKREGRDPRCRDPTWMIGRLSKSA